MSVEPLRGKALRSVQLATRSDAEIVIWEGSVRSGKTIASLIAWLIFVRSGPPGNLAMIGKTERTLKRNVIDPLVEMLGPKRCRYVAGAGELWILGRRIYVAGANDERSVGRIQGLTLVGAYVDEASLMPESFWAMLGTRLSADGARLFATSNPDSPQHWLMRDWLSRARLWLRHDGSETPGDHDDPLELLRFSFRLRDNPTLSERYLARLTKAYVGLWRLRFIEGLWVVAEGAIYDQLDTTVGGPHVVDGLDPGEKVADWVVAADYGTVNPFHALLLGLTTGKRIYVAAECRYDGRATGIRKTDADYSAMLREWLDGLADAGVEGARNPSRIHVDPSAASFIAQLGRDDWAGIRKADNAVVDGIRTTASLLGGGHLVIDAGCTHLIAEMSGYVWDSDAAKKGEEKPVKVDDHGPDALRYGVMGTRRWWRHWLAT